MDEPTKARAQSAHTGPIEPSMKDKITGERPDRLTDRIEDAAVEAEFQTGEREDSVDEAKANILVRLARITTGFVVVIIGIVLLPLPGPGWIIIAGGFMILSKDFEWADRTVRLIRRKVPGVPEDGKIPTSSKIMIVVVTVGAALIAYFFGDTIKTAIGDGWSWFTGLF